MLVVVGLLLFIVALVVGVVGVLGNSGDAHTPTDGFSVFGYHVTGSTGRTSTASWSESWPCSG